ncbi:hypothetical protein ACWOFR_11215 [Carnobacterium gallinarum]
MLSFDEKKAIFDSYSELTVNEVSMNRLNYHFTESAVAKTTVVKFLHPKNGNALIYAGYLPDEETVKGYISIRDEDEGTIHKLVQQAIEYLKKTEDGFEEGYSEEWQDDHRDVLTLQYSNGMWSILMSHGGLEAIFKTKEAAEGYLADEGFFY